MYTLDQIRRACLVLGIPHVQFIRALQAGGPGGRTLGLASAIAVLGHFVDCQDAAIDQLREESYFVLGPIPEDVDPYAVEIPETDEPDLEPLLELIGRVGENTMWYSFLPDRIKAPLTRLPARRCFAGERRRRRHR